MKSSQPLPDQIKNTIFEGTDSDQAESLIIDMELENDIIAKTVDESKFKIQDIVPVGMREIVVDESEANVEDDFLIARRNIMDITSKGAEALECALELIKATEHPRAIEVAANMMKTLTDINMSVIDLHDKKQKVKSKEAVAQPLSATQNNITNNFIGTTNDMLEIIKNKSRNST